MKPKKLKFKATNTAGEVGALLLAPDDARWLLVFAHGAGAGMHHPFMEEMGLRLATRGVATFRYQFPYLEHGGKRPDPKPILLATVRSAIEVASRSAPGLTVLAGGKSMGGRMTSQAAAEEPLPGVHGLVFFGFPLHPAGAPSTGRAAHLPNVDLPMLILQGTRDALADLTLLTPICRNLGKRTTLHVVDGADHSFHVLKSSGRTDGEVLDELADEVVRWARKIG
ncbi:MAG: alpha/beta hydrolase [Bacteroidetes bacterium]|nr:alpha/beta hydrolase [Bacteroidota bacterium]